MQRIATAAAALALTAGALLGLAGTSAADSDGISVIQCLAGGGQPLVPGAADYNVCWGGMFDGSPIDVDD
jgi:hypothetical protein